MKTNDFHIIAEAVLLYHEQSNSLFADHFIAEKLHLSPEAIRSGIMDWFHDSPEAVVRHLENEKIKQRITATVKRMKDAEAMPSPVRIQAMTEEETEQGGKNLSIHFYFYDTVFGPVLVASTPRGICHLVFADRGHETALAKLKSRFPNAFFGAGKDHFQQQALAAFSRSDGEIPAIRLHVKGTRFQMQTWEKLLKIPRGGLMSYSALAGDLKDSHALGAAVGGNPVALIIPCHRAVRASGEFGEYHWGKARKAALICLEALS